MQESIWITWAQQRRSTELSGALGAKLYTLLSSADQIPNSIIRYLLLSAKTIRILGRKRPKIVFAQNPSIILAALLSLIKPFFRYKLVVDRHSNFELDKTEGIKWKIFQMFSRYTVRHADLTIVTNSYLQNVVAEWNGRGYVLEDKLPELQYQRYRELKGSIKILFICTFSIDEPVIEVIEAMKHLDDDWYLYITGNYNNFKAKKDIEPMPPNIRFTGFLPEEIYQAYLTSVDIIIVLTKQEHTLTCGTYEGLVAGKPMVISDTETIREYFSKGVIYTKPEVDSISQAIKECVAKKVNLAKEIQDMRGILLKDWDEKFRGLTSEIETVKNLV